jgi:hypothetical protein
VALRVSSRDRVCQPDSHPLVSSHVARFSGPWETVDPSTVGLSAEALDAAESAVSRAVNNRKCFLVVKEVGSLFGAGPCIVLPCPCVQWL